MKIAIVQPRISYYTGGGEKLPLIHAKLLSNSGQGVTLYTTKVPKCKQSSLYRDFLFLSKNNLSIKEFKIPEKYKYLYLQTPGENRNRWDTESLLFNQMIFMDLKKDRPDIVISYYILDALFRSPELLAVLYLAGYPSDRLEIRRSFLRFFDATISISHNVKRQWGDYLNEVKQNFVLNSGVEINKGERQVKTNYSLNLVFAGRLIERKGVITLIEAMQMIVKKYPEAHLWIIGDGPQEDELVRKINSYGLNESITLTGIAQNVEDYFKMADICIFPSYEREGLMGVVLEAMSAGKPVISTKNNGNEDVIKSGINGLLIDPRNTSQLVKAVLSLIDDEKKRVEIGKKARDYVLKNLTWDTFINKFIKILQKINN